MRVFVILAMLPLAACVSTPTADQEATRAATLAKTGWAQEQICADGVAAEPQYVHLYQKLVIGLDHGAVRMPTPAQLSDKQTISDDDIGSGLDWYAETQVCDQRALDTFGKIDPSLTLILAHVEDQQTSLVREIVQKRPTYAYINQKIMAGRAEGVQEIVQWAKELNARLVEMRQQEEGHARFMADVGNISEALATMAVSAAVVLSQEQALAAQAQSTYALSHPMYVPVRKITMTNCQWIGSIWSCSSN